MTKKTRNSAVNDDPILAAFEETKGEQLDLLDMAEEPKQEKPKKPRKKPQPKAKKEVQEEVQEEVYPENFDAEEIVEEYNEEPETVWFTGYDGVQYTEEEWLAPVVRNGPSRMEVEEWKERHSGHVYFTPFESEVFVWRTLQRPEYREIIRDTTLNALDREEMFTEKCVLFPRNFSIEQIKKSRAGIASLLSEMIMDKSGFVAQSAPIKL
jgi:hypothetical protein